MRTLTYFILIFLSMATANAKNFYVSVNAGYNMGISTMRYGTESYYYYNFLGKPKIYHSGLLGKKSFGTGITPNFCFGYNVNHNISFGLSVNQLLGSAVSYNYESYTSAYWGGATIYNYEVIKGTETYKAKMTRIIPEIKISTDSAKFTAYLKLGFIVGLSSSIDKQINETATVAVYNGYSTFNSYLITQMRGGRAYGYSATLGANYKITKRWSWLFELNLMNLNYAPTTSDLLGGDIKYETKNMQYPRTKITNYTLNYTPPIITQPITDYNEVAKYYPFSSYGLNMGLCYSF